MPESGGDVNRKAKHLAERRKVMGLHPIMHVSDSKFMLVYAFLRDCVKRVKGKKHV